MSKARVYGFNKTYIPNAKADAYRRRKLHDKHREVADTDTDRAEERRIRKEMRELEKMKYGGTAV